MIKIILIDDDRYQAPLVQAYLEAANQGWAEFVAVSTLGEALMALARTRFDVILLDDKLFPYDTCSQTLPSLLPYIRGAKLFVVSASVADIDIPAQYSPYVTDRLDKFALRKHILDGKMTATTTQPRPPAPSPLPGSA